MRLDAADDVGDGDGDGANNLRPGVHRPRANDGTEGDFGVSAIGQTRQGAQTDADARVVVQQGIISALSSRRNTPRS